MQVFESEGEMAFNLAKNYFHNIYLSVDFTLNHLTATGVKFPTYTS
jgi:hypothetical protein